RDAAWKRRPGAYGIALGPVPGVSVLASDSAADGGHWRIARSAETASVSDSVFTAVRRRGAAARHRRSRDVAGAHRGWDRDAAEPVNPVVGRAGIAALRGVQLVP